MNEGHDQQSEQPISDADVSPYTVDSLVKVTKKHISRCAEDGTLDFSLAQQQCGFRQSWRKQLQNWILDFHTYWRVSITTTYHASALLDRFIANNQSLQKSQLQLVAMACIYIASKIHDSMFITGANLAKLADGMYTADDIKNMEIQILAQFHWDLNFTTVYSVAYLFAQFISDIQVRAEVHEFIENILRSSTVESYFNQFTSDVQGLAVVLCALQLSNQPSDEVAKFKDSIMYFFYDFTAQNAEQISDCWDLMKELFLINFPEYVEGFGQEEEADDEELMDGSGIISEQSMSAGIASMEISSEGPSKKPRHNTPSPKTVDQITGSMLAAATAHSAVPGSGGEAKHLIRPQPMKPNDGQI